MKIYITASSTKEFLYGLTIRPFGIATQPKGHTGFIDRADIPKHIRDEYTEFAYRYGILIYPEPLSARDIDHYSLTDFNLISDTEAWNRFVALVKEVKKDYELSLSDFVDYYIKPTGDYADRNPLYKGLKPKTNVVFQFLVDNGYQGSMRGLEEFYLKQ